MTADTDKMPKAAKAQGGITAEDLDNARKCLGVIRSSSNAAAFFNKCRKDNMVSALTALNWYLELLPREYGYEYLSAAANMARSSKVKDLGAVAIAIGDKDRSKLAKYSDGPIMGDESVCTSSQWRPPIKGRDEAYSAPDVSVIAGPSGGETLRTEGALESSSMLLPPGGQIPSAQEDDSPPSCSKCNSNSSSDSSEGSSDSGGILDPVGKVSDHSSGSDSRLAAPNQLPPGPHTGRGKSVVGDGLVDAVTNGSVVALDGGVRDQGAPGNGTKTKLKKKKDPNDEATRWRPRVCNLVWKGKTCPNRSNGCKFAHPNPCNSSGCAMGPSIGCRAFHPCVGGSGREKGNDRGSVRRGGVAPMGNKSKSSKPHRPNNNNSRTGGNSHSNNHSGLRERVEAMEKALKGRGGAHKPSYRDMLARGIPTTSNPTRGNSGSGASSHNQVPHHNVNGGFTLDQPDPAMLSTVVAAVMAVLSGRGRQLF